MSSEFKADDAGDDHQQEYILDQSYLLTEIEFIDHRRYAEHNACPYSIGCRSADPVLFHRHGKEHHVADAENEIEQERQQRQQALFLKNGTETDLCQLVLINGLDIIQPAYLEQGSNDQIRKIRGQGSGLVFEFSKLQLGLVNILSAQRLSLFPA